MTVRCEGAKPRRSRRALGSAGAAGAIALVFALVGCSAPSVGAGADDQGSSAEGSGSGSGSGSEAAAEPGTGSCEFTGEGPQTAELTETESGYEVTFSGDFISPETLLPETGRTSFTVTLWDPESGKESVSLITQYDLGKLSQSGVLATDGTMTALQTEPKLEAGSFTVTYPKPIEALETAPPTTWTPEMYVDAGDGTPGESFRCGDGQVIPYTPLGS